MVKDNVIGAFLRLLGGDVKVLGGFQHLLDAGARGNALGAHDENPGDGHHGVEDDGEVT